VIEARFWRLAFRIGHKYDKLASNSSKRIWIPCRSTAKDRLDLILADAKDCPHASRSERGVIGRYRDEYLIIQVIPSGFAWKRGIVPGKMGKLEWKKTKTGTFSTFRGLSTTPFSWHEENDLLL